MRKNNDKNSNRGKKQNYRNDKPKKYDPRAKYNKDEDQTISKSGPINNADYYFTDSTLKDQIGTISFNQFAGVSYDIATQYPAKPQKADAPTLMRLALNPSAGYTRNVGTANSTNLASLSLYTKLSANNAKTSIYAPQDLTTLILALGDMIALSGHIARIFGVARLFNFRNRSYPKSIISNFGIDYDDLVNHFAEYRNKYNLIMVSASQIPIPANIPYFSKCKELYAGLYLDMEGSSMAQTYAFVPYSGWILDEQAEGGTRLTVNEYFTYQSGVELKKSMATLLGILDAQVQALLNSTTLNAIYSDILRVAEKEGMPLLTFSTIPDDYVVIPTYQPEIRKWINNATVMGTPLYDVDSEHTSGNMVLPDPDNNGISYKPQFSVGSTVALEGILNFDFANPTPDDIIEGTRLTSLYSIKESSSGYVTDEVALPDHYVVRVDIYQSNTLIGYQLAPGINPFTDEPSTLGAMTFFTAASNFDWCYPIYVFDKNGAYFGMFYDTNYYTTLGLKYLRQLHDSSYFGLLSIR